MPDHYRVISVEQKNNATNTLQKKKKKKKEDDEDEEETITVDAKEVQEEIITVKTEVAESVSEPAANHNGVNITSDEEGIDDEGQEALLPLLAVSISQCCDASLLTYLLFVCMTSCLIFIFI